MVPQISEDTSTICTATNDTIFANKVSNSEPELVGYSPHNSLFYTHWQKMIDLAFGLVGTGILLLSLPILALLIYLDSPGPIFYSQIRVGFQGKLFRIYKFRSMRNDAERGGQNMWATQGDTRVTRIGRLLRASHMDELPQVVNILRGDMSLIGPRPEREAFAVEMEKIEPSYRYRVAVKPGLTGLAQVMYGYGSADRSELQKLHYDLYYIQHRSCFLDIVILLRTVGEVVFCHGI